MITNVVARFYMNHRQYIWIVNVVTITIVFSEFDYNRCVYVCVKSRLESSPQTIKI